MARGPRAKTRTAVTRARSARQAPSVAEQIAWNLLRNNKTGFKFRREYEVAGYRIDFYCAEAMVGVEFDGEQHDPARDAHRDQRLSDQGIQIFRIPNRSLFLLDEEPPRQWLDELIALLEHKTGRKAF